MTDLSKLSLDELIALQQRAAAEIETRQSAEKAKAHQEILSLASRYGIEIKFAGSPAAAGKPAKAKRSGSGSVAVKYRHPENSALTWTGRGRSPLWVAEWKAKHGTLTGITV